MRTVIGKLWPKAQHCALYGKCKSKWTKLMDNVCNWNTNGSAKHKQLCRKYANLSWKSKYSSTLISATRCTQTLAKKVTTTIEQSSWRRTPLHLRSTRRSCDAMTYSRAPSCARELSMLRKTGKTFAKNKTSLIFCEPLPQEAATKSNSGERIWESWTLFVHYSHIIAGGDGAVESDR